MMNFYVQLVCHQQQSQTYLPVFLSENANMMRKGQICLSVPQILLAGIHSFPCTWT